MSKVCLRALAPSRRILAPMSQATAPRKRGGQADRPRTSLLATCSGAQVRNSPATAARRSPISRREGLAIAVEGDAVKLHAMIDEAEAEALGDALLERLQLVVDEFDDVAGLDVDQMVVVRFRRGFVA